jgi:hypothetical protein
LVTIAAKESLLHGPAEQRFTSQEFSPSTREVFDEEELKRGIRDDGLRQAEAGFRPIWVKV